MTIASDLVDDVKILLRNWILENQVNFANDLKGITLDWPTVLEYLNKAVSAAESNDLPAGLFAAYDNARFNLWAFTALRGIKWDKNCFFSASESIKKLPEKTRDNIMLLLESKNLLDIQVATKELAEQLDEELTENGRKLPVCSTLEEAVSFLEIN